MSNSTSNAKFGSAAAFGADVPEEARKAMSGAFDAVANWRRELVSISDRNSGAVFDKMSAAAKSVGWPAEFVDMTREHMQNASKMQMQAMDHVMDAWSQQLKNPGAAFGSANAMMDQMKAFQNMGNMAGGFPNMMGSMPGMGSFPGMPDMSQMGHMPMVPLQFWMQAAEMWQKSWQQALSTWMEAQQNMMGKGK